ncbi:hypothetical protein [Microbulbifer aggregans]|uniref:hypothetical protein n=1 Tax=Microbulbifer aggregans TaxID=1769779 RepID=UPI001CFC66B0|nr:hypothetical protein [Microbulbifer aggregans]
MLTLTIKAAKAAYARQEISRPFYMNGGLYFTFIGGTHRGDDGYLVTATGAFKQFSSADHAGDAVVKITGDPLDRF